MSIIQQIREKAAWLVFGLIALSLIGFLLMDAFVGKSRLFGGSSTTVGVINGTKIEYTQYQQEYSMLETQYKSAGYPFNEDAIRNQVWNQFLDEAVMGDVYSSVGLQVGEKEESDLLYGENPAPEIRQAFSDPKTGVFDPQRAASYIGQLRTLYSKNRQTDQNYQVAKNFFEQVTPKLVANRLREKYASLLSKSAYTPKWMAEKINTDNSLVSSISYVNIPYTTIADSTVKVTDEEINNYVASHPDQFKQDENRSIAYVAFSAAPTAGDSASVKSVVEGMKNDFASAKDPGAFLAAKGSDLPYFDGYVVKTEMQMPHKDSLQALPVGAVFGPYLDVNNAGVGSYVLAKMIDRKQLPDSVFCRHILIASPADGSGAPDSVAKKRMDSVVDVIKKGSDFRKVMLAVSDDKAANSQDSGVMKFTASQIQDKDRFDQDFGKFILFDGKKGERKVVHTKFGYHYIEILDLKNIEPAYKIAYLAKNINSSDVTENAASGLASQFAGESRNQKSFDDNASKQKLTKLVAQDLMPQQSTVMGIGSSRTLVKWAYEASVGDVSEPFPVGDKYIVAVLTEINKKGLMNATKARPLTEPILRNRKKSDLIIKKIGSVSNLDAVASANGQQVRKSDSLGFSSPYIPNVGQEARVIGASFDKSLQGKPASTPIAGNGGVFVIRVENVTAKPNLSGDISVVQRTLEQRQVNMAQNALEVFKKTADIKDYRAKF